MTYYRNNIQHLFVLPSLVASIVLHYEAIQKDLLLDAVRKIYPFLKGELFLHFNEEELDTQIKAIIDEFARQEVIQSNDNFLSIHRSKVRILQLWSAGMREILQRYYITVSILRRDPGIARGLLEKESQLVAQRLSVLHGINAPEFFDKAVFSAFIANLKEEGYFDDDKEKLHELATILEHLISSEICLTINGAADKADEVEIEVEEEDKSNKDE